MATRNTATRDRHRAAIAKGKPPCGICGAPIDYRIPYRRPDGTVHPDAYVVDHIHALANGGTDTLDNKQASHARCNSIKYNKQPDTVVIEWATPRTW